MKAFKDLKVGDNIYMYYPYDNKCIKLKITDIVTECRATKFYYGGFFDYFLILSEELGLNNTCGIFTDVNSLLKYIEDER